MFFTSSMNDTVPIQYFLSMSKWVQIFMFTYRFSFTSMPCMKILLVSTLARETKWPYMNEYQVPPLNVQPWKLPKPLVPFCTFMHNLNQVPHWSEIPVIKTMQDFSRSLWAANLFIIHDIYMPRFGTLMYFARSMNTTHFLRPGLWMILRVLLLAPGVEHFFVWVRAFAQIAGICWAWRDTTCNMNAAAGKNMPKWANCIKFLPFRWSTSVDGCRRLAPWTFASLILYERWIMKIILCTVSLHLHWSWSFHSCQLGDQQEGFIGRSALEPHGVEI